MGHSFRGTTFGKLLRIWALFIAAIIGLAILIASFHHTGVENAVPLALFIGMACSLISGAILWLVYREVLRPLRIQQSYNIQQLDECIVDSCPTMKIPENLIPKNEIGDVMRSRNLMRDKLERTLIELRDNYERIENLEKLQSDLTRMIVHDLKNPLAVLIMSLDLLAQNDRLTKNQRSRLQLARRGTLDLMRMISNLLDISRMEEGKLHLHRELVSIESVVEDSVRDFFDAGMLGKRRMTKIIPVVTPECPIDRDLISRTLNNLVSNSIRHTQDNGRIQIAVTYHDAEQSIQVDVQDDGIGIPKEYHERIFEKFEQVGAREAGKRTGTGLGLAFCKLAVEAHGGKIWVESKPGRGSTFHFTVSVDPIDRGVGCSEDIQMLPRKFGRLHEKVTGPVAAHDRSEDQVAGKIAK